MKMKNLKQRNVEERISRAMTVADLRDRLANLPDDARVVFACDYARDRAVYVSDCGDAPNAKQAMQVQGVRLANGVIIDAHYSASGIEYLAFDEMDEDECGQHGDEESPNVVILW
jgi:hypothetical protein